MQRDLAEQVTSLQADQNGLVRRIRQLEQANGELLRDSEGKLAAVREELRQISAARDAVKAQLAASQRELVTSKKRLEQASRDRVNETGSIKAGDSTKKPTPKP
jgi:zinc resistance-associated protein